MSYNEFEETSLSAEEQLTKEDFLSVKALKGDLKKSVENMSRVEARFVCETYDNMQRERIRNDSRVKAALELNEPADFLQILAERHRLQEKVVAGAIKNYVEQDPLGSFMLDQKGIGPIIAGKLLTGINWEVVYPTRVWAFCGLDPTRIWLGAAKAKEIIAEYFKERGEKPVKLLDPNILYDLHVKYNTIRPPSIFAWLEGNDKIDEEGKVKVEDLASAMARRPWANDMKKVCYLAGKSFIHTSNREGAFYGKLYKEAKANYWTQNVLGRFAEQAQTRANYVGKDTEAYAWSTGRFNAEEVTGWVAAGMPVGKRPKPLPEGQEGLPMLTPAHIFSRAWRRSVRIFLAHCWEVNWMLTKRTRPIEPWVIKHGGHQDYIPPPGWEDKATGRVPIEPIKMG